jgi:hypothetical protein
MKQQQLLIRISQFFFYALMGISIVLVVIFYLNTGKINSADPLSAQISQIGPILNTFVLWAGVLILLAVIFAIGFPAFNMIANPKAGLKAIVSIGILALAMFVAYQLGDDQVLEIAGYNGPDNVPVRLKLTDMILYSVYGMTVIAIIAILYGEFSKLFK